MQLCFFAGSDSPALREERLHCIPSLFLPIEPLTSNRNQGPHVRITKMHVVSFAWVEA